MKGEQKQLLPRLSYNDLTFLKMLIEMMPAEEREKHVQAEHTLARLNVLIAYERYQYQMRTLKKLGQEGGSEV